jgi:cyclin-dependent kinase 10
MPLYSHKGTADFGLARPFGLPPRPLTPRVVTLWYRAPELLYGTREYTTAIDIWAAGCILGELLQSRPLLPGTAEINQLALIHKLLGSPSEEIWPGFDLLPYAKTLKLPVVEYDSISAVFPRASEGTKDLLKRLLTYWPEGRLTASKALRHAYFTTELPRPCDPALLPTYPELRNDQDSSVVEAVQRAQKRRKQEADFGK